MRNLKQTTFAVLLLPLMACGGGAQQQAPAETPVQDSLKNQVVETIMTRRSVRQYKPQAVEREKMQTIVECGINAPNAMNKQPWEVRVVDNADYINGVTELYKKANPKAAEDPAFKNMFRNAPTVVFIGHDTESESSPFDCGLLAENMMISAWSMGIGSCCLGSPARFMKTPEAAEYLQKLGFSEGYELLYCIGFGYPDEAPAAKPREAAKVKFVE
ncbi:nitroreductase family protein [Phocaeicola coprocola]|jgi:nitroreductase|uniref:nitroreductase family protein n=1 Tax=Phocaeicola coprocola TaxID=310298 RepID=UPI003AF17B03